MSYQIKGKIVDIQPTQQVTEKFKKRSFAIETTEEINGNIYYNYAKMQCVQAKCDLLDRFSVGEEVVCDFNVKGNKWTTKEGKEDFITNLDCWKIASTAANVPQPAPQAQQYHPTQPPSQPAYAPPAGAPPPPPAPVWNGTSWVYPQQPQPTTLTADDLPF